MCDELLYETNRADRTAIELFVAVVRGWEAGLDGSLTRNRSPISELR